MKNGLWTAAAVCGLTLAGCESGTQYCATPSRSNPETCAQFDIVSTLGPAGLAAGLYITAFCEVLGADAAPGTCPEEGRVGGCRDNPDDDDVDVKAISWTYTGTLDELECDADDIKLDAAGNPVSGDGGDGTVDEPAECSEAGVGLPPVNTTFDNQTGALGTMYWVDPDCIETRYAVLDAGATHDQSSYAGHYWILRAGDTDPTGDILWEGKLVEADNGATVTMD